jgi:formylglycine-generating enzyme required for sulfatase activity
VAATSVVTVSATTITADTPAGAAGAEDVVVTAVGGSGSLAGGFTYSDALLEFGFVQTNSTTGLDEYTHNQTGIEFVLLPGGAFEMGAQSTDPSGANYDPDAQPEESPVHTVTLSPFLIAMTEVTQAQYQAVLTGHATLSTAPSNFSGDYLPVEQVSWDDLKDADGFLARTGLALPTEAQWEYACRAGTSGPIAGTGILDEMAWYLGNSSSTTHDVRGKTPNAFGLFDMHGNVWEWCEDFYNSTFYSDPSAAGPDPVFSGSGSDRVYRGGSWGNSAGDVRAAFRSWNAPGTRLDHLGFRPARVLD